MSTHLSPAPATRSAPNFTPAQAHTSSSICIRPFRFSVMTGDMRLPAVVPGRKMKFDTQPRETAVPTYALACAHNWMQHHVRAIYGLPTYPHLAHPIFSSQSRMAPIIHTSRLSRDEPVSSPSESLWRRALQGSITTCALYARSRQPLGAASRAPGPPAC